MFWPFNWHFVIATVASIVLTTAAAVWPKLRAWGRWWTLRRRWKPKRGLREEDAGTAVTLCGLAHMAVTGAPPPSAPLIEVAQDDTGHRAVHALTVRVGDVDVLLASPLRVRFGSRLRWSGSSKGRPRWRDSVIWPRWSRALHGIGYGDSIMVFGVLRHEVELGEVELDERDAGYRAQPERPVVAERWWLEGGEGSLEVMALERPQVAGPDRPGILGLGGALWLLSQIMIAGTGWWAEGTLIERLTVEEQAVGGRRVYATLDQDWETTFLELLAGDGVSVSWYRMTNAFHQRSFDAASYADGLELAVLPGCIYQGAFALRHGFLYDARRYCESRPFSYSGAPAALATACLTGDHLLAKRVIEQQPRSVQLVRSPFATSGNDGLAPLLPRPTTSARALLIAGAPVEAARALGQRVSHGAMPCLALALDLSLPPQERASRLAALGKAGSGTMCRLLAVEVTQGERRLVHLKALRRAEPHWGNSVALLLAELRLQSSPPDLALEPSAALFSDPAAYLADGLWEAAAAKLHAQRDLPEAAKRFRGRIDLRLAQAAIARDELAAARTLIDRGRRSLPEDEPCVIDLELALALARGDDENARARWSDLRKADEPALLAAWQPIMAWLDGDPAPLAAALDEPGFARVLAGAGHDLDQWLYNPAPRTVVSRLLVSRLSLSARSRERLLHAGHFQTSCDHRQDIALLADDRALARALGQKERVRRRSDQIERIHAASGRRALALPLRILERIDQQLLDPSERPP